MGLVAQMAPEPASHLAAEVGEALEALGKRVDADAVQDELNESLPARKIIHVRTRHAGDSDGQRMRRERPGKTRRSISRKGHAGQPARTPGRAATSRGHVSRGGNLTFEIWHPAFPAPVYHISARLGDPFPEIQPWRASGTPGTTQ